MATRALSPRRPVGRASSTLSRPAGRGTLIRRRLIAAVIAIAVLYAGYILWFRNLPWFAIDSVTIVGATTHEREIKTAVERAAGDMTTLHIKDDQLRDAVAQFPTVATVRASTSFPHTLHVTIRERLPVGFIKTGANRTAVSGDGYLLPGASFDPKRLPRIEEPVAHGVRLDGDTAAQATILGAAPQPLRAQVMDSSWDEQLGGVVVQLDGGPEVRFGDGSRAREKWTAAVAVLSSPERGSPSYLDVSVPERPVSGG
jgi:cell division protein FtsQ